MLAHDIIVVLIVQFFAPYISYMVLRRLYVPPHSIHTQLFVNNVYNIQKQKQNKMILLLITVSFLLFFSVIILIQVAPSSRPKASSKINCTASSSKVSENVKMTFASTDGNMIDKENHGNNNINNNNGWNNRNIRRVLDENRSNVHDHDSGKRPRYSVAYPLFTQQADDPSSDEQHFQTTSTAIVIFNATPLHLIYNIYNILVYEI
jgi:hypothetical protein